MTTNFLLCKDLLKEIKSIEKTKNNFITVEISVLENHLKECEFCQTELMRLKKEIWPYLLKNISKLF